MRIGIRGNNKAIHRCVECGRKLSQYEYISCFNTCTSCKDKIYKARMTRYIDNQGDNKIDEILLNKTKER